MRLISLLKVMDEGDRINVVDENKPINKATVFNGSAGECMERCYYKNGVVTSLFASGNTLMVTVDIEYQKKKRAALSDAAQT